MEAVDNMDPNSILTSTNYDKRYATNNLMRTYELEFANGTIDQFIDYSDWDFTSIIKRIRNSRSIRYNGYEKFTTIVHRVYGNTTIYRLIMIFNGFMHPYEIESGAVIKLPDPVELSTLLQRGQLKKQTNSNNRSVLI